jgi:hypothetical protein
MAVLPEKDFDTKKILDFLTDENWHSECEILEPLYEWIDKAREFLVEEYDEGYHGDCPETCDVTNLLKELNIAVNSIHKFI